MAVSENWWEQAPKVTELRGEGNGNWWEQAPTVEELKASTDNWWEVAPPVSELQKFSSSSITEPAYLQARNQAIQQVIMQEFNSLAGMQDQAEPSADTRTAVQRILDAPGEVEQEMAAEEAGPEPEVEIPEEIEPLSNAVKAYRSFKVGSLGMADLVGGAAVWAGMEETGDQIREWAKEGISDNAVRQRYEDFEWGDLTEKEWWLTVAPEMVPSLLTLIPVAIGGGFGGGAAAAAFGLGRVGISISAAVGSALAARPLESAMEAMGTYNSLLDQGVSEEVASEQAADVFTKNLSLIGMDAAQFALAFAKIPAPLRAGMAAWIVRKGIRAAGFALGALSEGYEEVIQGYFQELGQQAAGVKAPTEHGVSPLGGTVAFPIGATFVEIDVSLLESLLLGPPEAKEAFALGVLGGVGFQTTGAIKRGLSGKDANNIIQEQIDKLTPEEEPSEETTEAAPAEPEPEPVPAEALPPAEKAPTEKPAEPLPPTPEVEPPAKKPVEAVPPKEPEIGPEKADLEPKEEPPAPVAAEPTPPTAEGLPTVTLPVASIKIDETRFQPREAIDPALVESIAKGYDPAKWSEPILWEEPVTGDKYIVAGHHRQMGVTKGGFKEATYKVLPPGTTEEQARSLAQGSNLDRVEHTDWENAAIVRERVDKGDSIREVYEDLPGLRSYSKTANLLRLGYLNKKGRFKENWGNTEFTRITSFGYFVGGLRKQYSWLNDTHEKNIFDFLYKHGAAHNIDSAVPKEVIANAISTWDLADKPPDVLDFSKDVATGLEARADTAEASRELKEARRDLAALSKVIRNPSASIETITTARRDMALLKEKIRQIEGAIGEMEVSQEELKLYSVTGPINPELVKSTIKEVQSFGSAVKKTLERTVRRGTTHMRKLGEGGQQLAKDVDEIAFKVQREVNNDTQDIRKIMRGLNEKERINVAMVTDNEISAESQPERITKRAEQLRKVLDRQLENFAEVGGLRRIGGPGAAKKPAVGVGHAFPQIPNKEGKQVLNEVAAGSMNPWWNMTPRVAKAVEWMVEKGLAKNADAAVQQLAKFRDQQLRGVSPYFERTRNPLPRYLREWDPHRVLSGAMERGWLTIEGIRKWGWDETGVSFPRADELLGKIALESPFDSELLHQFIQASFGLGSRASEETQRISRDLRAVQFIGKIAMSPLTITRNMIDRFAKAYTTGGLSTTLRATLKFPPFVNVWIKSSEQIKDQMIRSGAVFSHGSIAEGIEPATIIMKMVGAPFTSSERGNQIFEALVAKMKLERDINLYLEAKPKSALGKIFKSIQSLGENTESEIAERIKEAGLADKSTEELVKLLAESKGGDLLPIEVQAVLHRASRDQAFPVILSTKRLWWDNQPFMKVLAQFKVWPIEQIGFFYRSAMVQAIRGNIAPLLRFIIGVIIAGELYNIFRDAVYDKEEALLTTIRKRPDKHNPKDVAWILLKDALDGGLVGMFADLTWGITDWILGPTAATIGELGKTIVSAIRRPGLTVHALKRAVRRDVSMTRQAEGILNKVGVWIGRDSKRAVLYRKWRGRANEYWREKNIGVIEQVEKTIMGPPSYPVGKNALVYDLIARAITAKEIEGAAEYIRMLVDEKATPKERKKAWAGLRQSRGQRSPFGLVALKNRREFLNQFSEEDQQEARGLQREWIVDYNRAMVISRKARAVLD